jgi:hypothetical protein
MAKATTCDLDDGAETICKPPADPNHIAWQPDNRPGRLGTFMKEAYAGSEGDGHVHAAVSGLEPAGRIGTAAVAGYAIDDPDVPGQWRGEVLARNRQSTGGIEGSLGDDHLGLFGGGPERTNRNPCPFSVATGGWAAAATLLHEIR